MSATQHNSPSRTAIVLYGTETGNAQDIAGEVSQVLERLHFQTDIEELDVVNPRSLEQYDLTAFCISTTGQGDFPSNARKFWLSLLRKKLTSNFLKDTVYFLVGLCDNSYPKFNFAARKLDKRLQQLGAVPLLQPCEADEQGEDGIEGAYLAWLPLLKNAILETYPLPSGQEPIKNGIRLPSKWILKEETESKNVTNGTTNLNNSKTQELSVSKARSFVVSLAQNERITPKEHWQDVRLLQLRTTTPVAYMPGDALAIYPRNAADDVEKLLNELDWQDVADVPLAFHYNREGGSPKRCPDPIYDSLQQMTLRQLLTTSLDINAIPRRSFFANIAHFTNDEMQKERALEFTDPQYLDEYFDYATRPRRSILEVLQEFNTVKIPWQEATNVLPILRPRQFSIASGGSLKEGGFSFDLLIAIVRYRTVIKRIREGVCTRYLSKLPIGTELNVELHTEGRFQSLPSSIPRNHLLIGGGTGIAPLRALIYEKISLNTECSNTLVFGCRNVKADYFFEDEWRKLLADPNKRFNLITAFSRDQQQKIYIQDRIREHGTSICDMLTNQDAAVVVCGSSGQMPKAVRQALRDVLVTYNTRITDDDEAEQFLVRLEKLGMYKQETW